MTESCSALEGVLGVELSPREESVEVKRAIATNTEQVQNKYRINTDTNRQKRSSSAKVYVAIKSWNFDFLARNCQMLNRLLDSKWRLLSRRLKGKVDYLFATSISGANVSPQRRKYQA